MPFQKKDFIEIDFTGKTTEGNIFDSNIKENLKKLNSKIEPKPFVFCIGQGMFLQGIDDFLIGKEVGKYNIDLTPEGAFGPRNSQLVQMMPLKLFVEHKINPVQGAAFNFDGKIGKILTVSGGRVMVDFNNPLAGKDVIYEVNVLRKVEDINEKIKAFNDFLFKRDLKFEIKGKTLILEAAPDMKQFLELFKDKYKEIFELDLEVRVTEANTKSPKKSQ